jgi:MFS family permease
VVLPLQVYQLTRSSFLVGLIGVAEFVPMFFVSLLGGALSDVFERRRLLLWSELGLALCSAALIANSLLPEPRVWVLFAIASLSAVCDGIHRPAVEALTPRLVPTEQMPAVAALGSLRFNFNYIVGPALAGVIAARFGFPTAFAIDLCTYLVAYVTLVLMRSVPPPVGADRVSLLSIAAGLRYARNRQELLGTYLIDLNAMFFGMPMALFPAIAESFGGASVGLFYAMPAAGALVVSLTAGWVGRIHRHGIAVALSATFWGLAILAFGLSRNLYLALFFLALAGAADGISTIFRRIIWSQTIPDHLRGRLASLEMISYLTGPYLGNAEAGIVAGAFGLRFSVASGGILCVLGSALIVWLLPRFWTYDGRDGIARRLEEEAALAGGSGSAEPPASPGGASA